MNENFIADIHDIVALACKAKGMWGVYCSWTFNLNELRDPDNYAAWTDHIRGCLPAGELADDIMPINHWFLRLFDNETSARSYYSQCRGDDDGVHDGVYAMVIDSTGNIRCENT